MWGKNMFNFTVLPSMSSIFKVHLGGATLTTNIVYHLAMNALQFKCSPEAENIYKYTYSKFLHKHNRQWRSWLRAREILEEVTGFIPALGNFF